MSPVVQASPSRVSLLLDGMARRIGKNSPRNDGMASADVDRIKRLGMSPRQLRLNHLLGWYRCAHYDARKSDWNGREVLDPIEHEAIASQGFIPPGFYDAGQTLPIKFRRPVAPYHLPRVIVDRFTSLLFSARQHPYISVAGDDATNDFVGALIEVSRLWPQMLIARQYGGATGTVVVGFQFIDGKPVVEVHDPRWVNPVFKDRGTFKLGAFEVRYMFPVDERDETGAYATGWYWYRRIVDEKTDTLFKPAPVGEGEEPEWIVDRQIVHGFGFCPAVWVQNLPVQDDLDGDPDCLGVYDLIEAMDSLLAQANRGILANCDPTLIITTDAEMGEVQKGSDNAIKLPGGGNAHYMEMAGSGPKAALELAQELRKAALEVAQCILDHPEMSARTATEVERLYSPMLAKADILREQYGHRCVLPLMEMMLVAARQLDKGRVDPETGEIVRQVLVLPPRVTTTETGEVQLQERRMGPGGVLGIQWHRYFALTLADVELATRGASLALTGGLIDLDHAVKFTSEYFEVADVARLIAKLKEEKAKAQGALDQQTMGFPGGPLAASPEEPSAGAPQEEPPYDDWYPEEDM